MFKRKAMDERRIKKQLKDLNNAYGGRRIEVPIVGLSGYSISFIAVEKRVNKGKSLKSVEFIIRKIFSWLGYDIKEIHISNKYYNLDNPYVQQHLEIERTEKERNGKELGSIGMKVNKDEQALIDENIKKMEKDEKLFNKELNKLEE